MLKVSLSIILSFWSEYLNIDAYPDRLIVCVAANQALPMPVAEKADHPGGYRVPASRETVESQFSVLTWNGVRGVV